ncbi:hypothetical protein ASZ90_006260 [hydrocarbon metagenome]|uniref:Uncharacterized protein n=1 Tax=hydrocarbon metagenome TaxID=938273 RepID=A0A0W8FSW3_9ZZZZ
MKQFHLYDILCSTAKKSIEFQKEDGCFPEGHNGPWHDFDTHVRTTAHWALTVFKAYEITDEKIFLDATLKACDYLIKKEQRPSGYTFYCRTNQTGKNMCNGLIGQAWAIEPLIFIGESLNVPEYLNVAQKTALLHEYDYRSHLWRNKEISGKTMHINPALNQQVWFAALLMITGRILNDKTLQDCARDFFTNFPARVSFVEEGLVRHRIENKSTSLQIIKSKMRLIYQYGKATDADKIKLLSQGYLSFLLYGLALAYHYSSGEDFWDDIKMKTIISCSVDYIVGRFPFGCGEKTGYRWCYNPTGIEISYVLQVFQKYLKREPGEHTISAWLNKQFEYYYDFDKKMMCKNTEDPVILSSRIYEAARLNNYSLSIFDHG